jgi:hypothetical protein
MPKSQCEVELKARAYHVRSKPARSPPSTRSHRRRRLGFGSPARPGPRGGKLRKTKPRDLQCSRRVDERRQDLGYDEEGPGGGWRRPSYLSPATRSPTTTATARSQVKWAAGEGIIWDATRLVTTRARTAKRWRGTGLGRAGRDLGRPSLVRRPRRPPLIPAYCLAVVL